MHTPLVSVIECPDHDLPCCCCMSRAHQSIFHAAIDRLLQKNEVVPRELTIGVLLCQGADRGYDVNSPVRRRHCPYPYYELVTRLRRALHRAVPKLEARSLAKVCCFGYVLLRTWSIIASFSYRVTDLW